MKHREEVVNVFLSLRAKEPIPSNYLCPHCPKRSKNTQGLSAHDKSTDGNNVDTKPNKSNKIPVTSHRSTIDDLISEDVAFIMNSLIKLV